MEMINTSAVHFLYKLGGGGGGLLFEGGIFSSEYGM